MKLDTKFSLAEILVSDNLAEQMSDEDLSTLGKQVVHNYNIDKESRSEWEERTEESMELALQVVENKTFPWDGASNVKFPLITIAALQYHARAYPALIPGTSIVKARVFGDDPDGIETARAKRIETHMSFQLLEEDEDWEDQMDKVLITQPIIGCAFKKTYFDPVKNINISENILAKDLVVSYYTKSLETAPRISHVIPMSHNDIREKVVGGLFRDIPLRNDYESGTDVLQEAQNEAQGTHPGVNDKQKPYEVIEQHCWLDLDGDDYEEPYIVVVCKESSKVLRVVARFFPSGVKKNDKNKVISITPEYYFTKYPFITSPDGGFYDLGFGALLGPLNESINTIINQLIDAGTMSNTGGGFLSRGIKTRGGVLSFSPNEWKTVDSTGDDLRKGIVPLPVREPSQVLFTLLQLLINYGERIGGAVDVMVGENPGQNTPAETSRNMTEQGMKIFSGIFKRTYRSLKKEFRKLYRLNQLYMIEDVKLGSLKISVDDYNADIKSIVPAADPDMVTDSQKLAQANTLFALSKESSGFDSYQVAKRMLQALKIDDIESVLPDPKGPNAIQQAPHYKVQEAEVKAKAKGEETQSKLQIAMIEFQQNADLNAAKIAELEAKAVKLRAEAAGVDTGHNIAMLQTQISAAKNHQEGILKSLQLMKDIQKEKNLGVDITSKGV